MADTMKLLRKENHGTIPNRKPPGVAQFLFENLNTICLWNKGSKKIEGINIMVKQFEADYVYLDVSPKLISLLLKRTRSSHSCLEMGRINGMLGGGPENVDNLWGKW